MKPLVLYHAQCADGFGAAFAAWLKLGDDAEYVPMQYLDSKLNAVEAWEALSAAIPSQANTGREVYILDFSLPKPVMDKLFAVSERVVWLDHHKSAFEMWCGEERILYCEDDSQPENNRFIHLNNNKSGAYLAWEYFHPGTEVPLFIRHIDDYDRWQFKIEGSKAFQKALWSYAPWSFENWRAYLYFGVKALDEGAWRAYTRFIAEGEAILRAHEQNVQSVVKSAVMNCVIKQPSFKGQNCEDTNYPYYIHAGLAANCPPHLHSDVGHELAKQSGAFGLCWCVESDGRVKVGLRSASDYDVQKIAKALGGGGHARASGFYTDMKTLMGWLKPESK